MLVESIVTESYFPHQSHRIDAQGWIRRELGAMQTPSMETTSSTARNRTLIPSRILSNWHRLNREF
jgi:hypothetical protein